MNFNCSPDAEITAKLVQLRLLFIRRVQSDIENLRKLAGSLETSGAAHDREGIRKIAHSIAGAAGTFGFPEISSYAAVLEDRFGFGARDRDIAALARQTADDISRRVLELNS